jgi:hypothetical protein
MDSALFVSILLIVAAAGLISMGLVPLWWP